MEETMKFKQARYSAAAAVANAFLFVAKEAGKTLTNMQLQKLVFIAHGITLAEIGRPLYYNDTEVWRYGPVIPDLYQALKRYGAGVVRGQIPDEGVVPLGSPEGDIIESVYRDLGEMSGWELSGLTHQRRSPWAIAREKGLVEIPDELVQQQFSLFKEEGERAAA